VFSLSKKDVAR